jgi:hypothetical protein
MRRGRARSQDVGGRQRFERQQVQPDADSNERCHRPRQRSKRDEPYCLRKFDHRHNRAAGDLVTDRPKATRQRAHDLSARDGSEEAVTEPGGEACGAGFPQLFGLIVEQDPQQDVIVDDERPRAQARSGSSPITRATAVL